MNTTYISYGLYTLLVIVLFFTIYSILKDIKPKRMIDNVVNKSELKTKERTTYYEQLYEEQGVTDKIGFKRKLDIYLIRSGIKERFRFINADIFLLTSVLISLGAILLVLPFIRHLGLLIAVGIITFLVLQFVVYFLANITYEKIDSQVIVFLNLLENFASSTDDIISIFQQSSEYLTYPLNKYCKEFVTESRTTGNTKSAFSNFEDKIENEKLKDIIRNLEISSRNDANYSEILSKSKDVIKGYFETKESKKAIKRSGQMDICMSAIMGVVVISVMQNLIPDLKYQLINTTIGNIIILYWIIVSIVCVASFVTLQKN